MEIGKPKLSSPLKKKTGDFKFIPFNLGELEITFQGSRNELIEVKNYWNSIGSPEYNEKLDFGENLQNIYKKLRYWPKPMLNNNVVQTMLLEYEDDNKGT